jgi:hypothetical protein
MGQLHAKVISHEVTTEKGEDDLKILCTNLVFNRLLIREEHRPSVCENMLLRNIFGPKREVLMRLKKICLTEELPNLYSLPHMTRVIKLRRVR